MSSRRSLIATFLAVSLLYVPRPAHALTDVQIGTVVSGSVALALVVTFATYDLVMHERNQTPSRAMATLEVSAMSLQIAMGISLAAVGGQRGDDLLLPVGVLMSVFAVPFLLHGFTSLRKASATARLLILPTVDGERGWARVGLHAVGVF